MITEVWLRFMAVLVWRSEAGGADRPARACRISNGALRMLIGVAMLGVVVLVPVGLFAQSSGGSVVGAVYDSTGAGVSGASVKLTGVATGAVLAGTSTSTGKYQFPVVPVGEYNLSVIASGFNQVVIKNVAVSVSTTTTQDVTLKVGATTEVVDVVASGVQLQSSVSQANTTVDSHTYSQLPMALSGAPRSPYFVEDLMTGVADAPNSNASPTNHTFQVSVNGGQTFGAEVLYDGAAILQTNVAGDMRVQPVPVDALQEFTLVQNTFSAEFGHTPGGILSFNTKSGTNNLHGEAYEYLQNDAFDAIGYFPADPTHPHKKSPLKQNEFGASLGGAIIKDKTFFFGYYSGFRLAGQATSGLTTIPTVAMRSGDFSQYLDSNGNQIPIFDPNTTSCSSSGCTRTQFPGNVIPSARISAMATAFLPYIPNPANSGQINNATLVGPNTLHQNAWGVKIDHYFNPKNVVHGFFGTAPEFSDTRQFVYKDMASGGAATSLPKYLLRISDDFLYSNRVVNHFTFGLNRAVNDFKARSATPNNLGVANTPTNNFPCLGIAGYEGTIACQAEKVTEKGMNFNDFVSIVKGNHQIKLGFEYRRNEDDDDTPNQASLSFSSLETDDPSNPTTTGNGFASLLLGSVDSGNEFIHSVNSKDHFVYLAGYAQDDYKVTPSLTVNLGLRYEIPYTRASDAISSFDPNVANPGAGGRLGAVVFTGVGPGRTNDVRFSNVDYHIFQPRVGAAYRIGDKNVIRAAFGIFSGTAGDVLENGIRAAALSAGFNATPSFSSPDNGITPAFNTASGFPAFPPPPFIDPTVNLNGFNFYVGKQDGIPPDIKNWTVDFQRQLSGKWLVDVAYVGNSAHHLGSNLINPDQLDPKYLSQYGTAVLDSPLSQGLAPGVPLPYPGFTGTVAQALRPFPQYNSIFQGNQTTGSSRYDSLQAKLQRQFSSGMSVLVSYTYAHLQTNAESSASWSNWARGGGAQNTYNLAPETSLSAAVPPQVLSVAYVYELPFGSGKPYLNSSSMGRAVLGGWSLSGILRYQSGEYFGVTTANALPLFNSVLRPDLTGQPILAHWSGRFNPVTDTYLNLGAFATPANFLGNAPPTLPVRGFAYQNEDVGVTKRVRLAERASLEIRGDAFNVFNRVTFSNPSTFWTPNSTTFGKVTSQANIPRRLQVSARVTF